MTSHRPSAMDSKAPISPLRICAALLIVWLLFRIALVSNADPPSLSRLYSKTRKLARNAIFTPLRRIPGPWYAPWTNLWLKVQVMGGSRCHYIHSLHERYGLLSHFQNLVHGMLMFLCLLRAIR